MKILIAGGGTGGHLFPALAIAKEFVSMDSGNKVFFVGSRRGIENRVIPKEGFPLHTLKIEGFKRKLSLHTIKVLFLLPMSLLSSFLVIRKFKPDAILGVGGYSSGPVVLMGAIMRYPCYIHEQNIFPGKTNRLLGRMVKTVFLSFPQSDKFFPGRQTLCVGTPLREEILKLGTENNDKRLSEGDNGVFTVLIFGGSLGAHNVNMGVVSALEKLTAVKTKLRFIHQTGERDFEDVKKRYANSGFDAEVFAFIENMAEAYSRADMIICRAGASTLAELAFCGKPALLIPYPFAAENHQEKNARMLSCVGAAFVLSDNRVTGISVAKIITHLINKPALGVKMGNKVREFCKVDSSIKIIDSIYGDMKYNGE